VRSRSLLVADVHIRDEGFTLLFVVVDGTGESPVNLARGQTIGTETIESGLIDAWDAIRAWIVAVVGESREFCTSICGMLMCI
jgi:hypothetical protein